MFLTPPDFPQYPNILLVPRVVYAALDAYETVQINPVGVRFSILSADSVFPSRRERNPLDGPQKVDAIRGNAQLEYLLVGILIQ